MRHVFAQAHLIVLLGAALLLSACTDARERLLEQHVDALRAGQAAALEERFIADPANNAIILEAFLRNGIRFENPDRLAAAYVSRLVFADTGELGVYERMLSGYDAVSRDRAILNASHAFILAAIEADDLSEWGAYGDARRTLLALRERVGFVAGVRELEKHVAPLIGTELPDKMPELRQHIVNTESRLSSSERELRETPEPVLIRGYIHELLADGLYGFSSSAYSSTTHALAMDLSDGAEFTTTGYFQAWVMNKDDAGRDVGDIPVVFYLPADLRTELFRKREEIQAKMSEDRAVLAHARDALSQAESAWGEALATVRRQLDSNSSLEVKRPDMKLLTDPAMMDTVMADTKGVNDDVQ